MNDSVGKRTVRTRLSRKQIAASLARHLAAVASVAATKLLLNSFEPYLKTQIIALLYLIPVVVSTVFWGMTPGLLAGIAAFLVFNYFYLPPFNTFSVHSTLDLITLLVFLVISLVMSQLIGRAREAVKVAQSREWEATRMYELISAIASLQDTAEIARELADQTLETFHARQVEVSTREGNSPLIVTDPSLGADVETPSVFVSIPLKTSRGSEGEIRIRNRQPFSDAELRLLEAYAGQGALALERVRLSESENKAQLLQESDNLKSSLLNSVSHELRSPLSAIKASVSSLRSGTVDWSSSDRGELLATIEEETDHLNALVGNLLQMSRIESGALHLQKRWNSYEEIVMSAAAKMRKQLAAHSLQVNLPQDLPLVPTDYVLIEQVFTNLLSNSVKYAPTGTVITITAEVEGDTLHTYLTNQSPAVAEEHIERIFDKFYRITNADRITGTGLGLSICKGIIEAHGGKIWAENTPQGFVFNFTLPLALDGVLPAVPKEAEDE